MEASKPGRAGQVRVPPPPYPLGQHPTPHTQAACMLLRIDDILSGMRNTKGHGDERGGQPEDEGEGGGMAIGDD